MRLLSPRAEVRSARASDVAVLIELMRALAEFEGYLGEFRVNETELLVRAFGEHPQCQVFVAELDNQVVGYAVALEILFTFDLCPTALLKELYVAAPRRGAGLGRMLLQAVARWALERGAGRLKWDVLAGNAPAEAFYQQQGGRPDSKWVAYHMGRLELERLADQADTVGCA